MPPKNFARAAVLAAVLSACFLVASEIHWRSQGFPPSHNDDRYLWAIERRHVYRPEEETTVFIGGSRIKFDLDIPTWKRLTGEDPVQLALVGTPARPVLHDLANDPSFKGKLVIDVMEPQFFSLDSIRREQWAREALQAYHEATPAQWASSYLNFGLESTFTFLEEGKFGANALLADIPLSNRPGVFVFPSFPKGFGITTAKRQTYMLPEFVADTAAVNRQRHIWGMLMLGMIDKSVPSPEQLKEVLAQTKRSVDKIMARGGTVIFVRPPSSGPMLAAENKYFPREKFWEALLQFTHTPGIHYADYPAMTNFNCPEWSHLTKDDAVKYTEALVHALQQKGWKFAGTQSPTAAAQQP